MNDPINIYFNVQEKFCKVMKLESHKKGKAVFHYRDTADKFYIILKGKVNV